MKTAASNVESMPCIIINGRGHDRMIVTSGGNLSMSKLSPFPWESLTTICVAPGSRHGGERFTGHEFPCASILESGWRELIRRDHPGDSLHIDRDVNLQRSLSAQWDSEQ